MKGKNQLILNTATMLELVQEWLDNGAFEGTNAVAIKPHDDNSYVVTLDTPETVKP